MGTVSRAGFRATNIAFSRFSILLVAGLSACSAVREPPPSAPPPRIAAPAPEKPIFTQTGTASWYGRAHEGKPTASGEPFDKDAMTAAHRSLSFGTIARVTRLENGTLVKIRINDRGPMVNGRVLDLSQKAAEGLGIVTDGTARVRIEVFASDQPKG